MGNHLQVRNVNLNLFPILLKLLLHRNVTRVANELCLTQSAVSGSLKRLRDIFSDELLITQGRELVLTEKAKRLLPMLEQHQISAETLLGGVAFDPASTTIRFRISTADWVSFLLVPVLTRRLSECSPNVSVQFIQGDRSNAKELREGVVDMLIGPEKISDWTGLNLFNDDSDYGFEQCYVDHLIGIESSEKPVPGIELDREIYLRHPHVTFNFGTRLHASVERDTLNEYELNQNDQFLVSEFTTLPYFVAATGAVSVIPSSLSNQMKRILPIRTFTPPLEFAPIKLIMVWANVRNNDPSMKWLRVLVRECFQELLDNTPC